MKWVVPTDDVKHGYGKARRRARHVLRHGSEVAARRRSCQARRLVRPLQFNFEDLRQARFPKDRWPPSLKVPVVTGLLIRRQNFRNISANALRSLVSSLPSLQSLHQEHWRPIKTWERFVEAQSFFRPGLSKDAHWSIPGRGLEPTIELEFGKGTPLIARLPVSIRHLRLFEDFDPRLHGREDVYTPRASECDGVLPSLKSKRNLESLAISFLVDAVDCFGLRPYYLKEDPGPDLAANTFRFPNMEYIVLTSQEHLRPTQCRGTVNAFLRAAAAVALKMPKLRTMELWNCGLGHACVFRWEPTPTRSSCRLTWRSNWEPKERDILALEPAVLRTWDDVARALGSPAVVFERRPLPVGVRDGEYDSHHDLLRLGELKLARYVMHETSCAQVAAEAVMTADARMWYAG